MIIDPDWDKEQFLTFVLLYAAHADLKMTPEEEEYISSSIGEEEYQDVKEVFDSKTELERAQMITSYAQEEEFDREYGNMVKNELEDLFMADGQFSHWEKSIGRALVRLMNI